MKFKLLIIITLLLCYPLISQEKYLGPAFQVHNYFSNNIISDPSYVIDYPSNDANLNYVLDETNKTVSLSPTSNDDNTVIYFLDKQFEPIEEIRTNDNGIYNFTTPIYNQDLYKLNIGYIYKKVIYLMIDLFVYC